MRLSEPFLAPKKFELKEERAAAKPLSSGDKVIDKEQILRLAEQISEQQAILFAENRRKFLVVLQGMDTSGKDGTVSSVFGRVNPQGMRVISFKSPSPLESL